MVPPGIRAALEMTQSDLVLEFPVVILDPPEPLGEPDEPGEAQALPPEVGQPVLRRGGGVNAGLKVPSSGGRFSTGDRPQGTTTSRYSHLPSAVSSRGGRPRRHGFDGLPFPVQEEAPEVHLGRVLTFGAAQQLHQFLEKRPQAPLSGAERFRIHAASVRHAEHPANINLT